MTWRRAWTYLGIFLLLGGYYAATEPRSDADAPALPARRAFLAAASADVREVTVQRGLTTVHCVRDGERWRVDSPAHARIPSDLVAALVEQLTGVPDVEVVDEQGQRAGQFGLDPPEGRVTLILADGRTLAIAMGARNPAHTAVYGRLEGTPRIVLLGMNLVYYQDLVLQAAATDNG